MLLWAATGDGAVAVGSLVGTADGTAGASQVGPFLIDEPDHMRQCGIVSQLAVLVARNVVDLADGREHLRLLDGIDAEIGFEIEIQVQHVFRIAGLLHDQRKNAFLHGIVGVAACSGTAQMLM